VRIRPLAFLLLLAAPLAAQAPAGQPKPRLELADSARRAPTAETPRTTVAASAPRPVHSRADSTTGLRRLFSQRFVRNQALLGIGLYGPSFALTVAKDPVPATAAYLVMAGGSFFAAAELSRDLTITEGMEMLATHMPIRGAAIGAALQYALTGRHEYAPGIFFGSILGTTGALTLGQRLTPGAAMASIFGADAGAALAMATIYAFKSDTGSARGRAAAGAGAALAGMQLGAMYASYAKYNVTAGDVQTLWTSSAIGAVAAGAAVANGHPGTKKATLTLIGGSLAGLVAGDRFLVRRFDHTPSEGALVGVAGTAGALMGGGVAVLAGAGARFNAATAALGAAGAVGGVVMAERWMAVRPDGARKLARRVTFTPQSLAFAAARVPGTYSIASFSF
jgi:hypothetical protein